VIDVAVMLGSGAVGIVAGWLARGVWIKAHMRVRRVRSMFDGSEVS